MTVRSGAVKRRVRAWRPWARALGVMALAWLLTLAPLPWPVSPVMAATFTVNTTADTEDANPGDGVCADSSGNCSLRAAIMEANALPGPDTIVLQSGQTYTLSKDTDGGGHATDSGADNDDLDITSAITIQGNGATIRRASTPTCNLNGTADTGEFRIFEVAGTGNLTLQNVTVRNGCADGSASPDTVGGGILNSGGTVTVTGSTISGNNAQGAGGGIRNAGGGTVTVTNSTISGNSTSGNGGGIWNGSTLTVTNSTISGNSASSGGGIWNGSTLSVTNSTISGNSASGSGGGIRNAGGTSNLSFVTIASNSASTGGGINRGGGTVNIKNSIVGNNTASTGPNCSGGVTATGANFATDTVTSCGATNFTYVPSTGPGGLNLGALQVNAPGTTATHALQAGSAAIDAVMVCTDLSGASVTTDQRGSSRITEGLCDAGAYEAQLVTLKDDRSARCVEVEVVTQTYAFDTATTPPGVLFGAVQLRVLGARIQIRNIGGNPLNGTVLTVPPGQGAAVLSVLSLRRIFSIGDRNLADTPHSCPGI